MNYSELSERLRKTLYYGILPKVESSSLSLTSKGKETYLQFNLPSSIFNLTFFLLQMSLLKNLARMMICFWRDSALILLLIFLGMLAFLHVHWFWP